MVKFPSPSFLKLFNVRQVPFKEWMATNLGKCNDVGHILYLSLQCLLLIEGKWISEFLRWKPFVHWRRSHRARQPDAHRSRPYQESRPMHAKTAEGRDLYSLKSAQLRAQISRFDRVSQRSSSPPRSRPTDRPTGRRSALKVRRVYRARRISILWFKGSLSVAKACRSAGWNSPRDKPASSFTCSPRWNAKIENNKEEREKTAAAAAMRTRDDDDDDGEERERERRAPPAEWGCLVGAQAAADTDDYRKLYAILPPPRESAHSHRVPLAFVRLSAVDLPRRWPLPSQAQRPQSLSLTLCYNLTLWAHPFPSSTAAWLCQPPLLFKLCATALRRAVLIK